MRTLALLSRAALVGGLALVGAGLGVSSASAASGDIEYSCEWAVDDTTGEDDTVASWDSAIPDDGELVVQPRTRVELDPYTGSITLPEAFVDALREADRTELDVAAFQVTVVDETGDAYLIDLDVETTAIPADGPMTLDVTAIDAGRVDTRTPGTVTLLAVFFAVYEGDLESDGEPTTYLTCDVAGDEQDAVVDVFTVAEAATPTPTVTVTVTPTPTVTVSASPRRPVLVQTDAPESAGPGSSALAVAGLGAGALLLVGGRRLVRRPARRH